MDRRQHILIIQLLVQGFQRLRGLCAALRIGLCAFRGVLGLFVLFAFLSSGFGYGVRGLAAKPLDSIRALLDSSLRLDADTVANTLGDSMVFRQPAGSPDTSGMLPGKLGGGLELGTVDSAQIDPKAGAKKPEKDSVLVYDAAIFSRVAPVDTVLRIHRWVFSPSSWSYREEQVDSAFRNVQFMDMPKPDLATYNGQGLHYAPYISDDFFARPEVDSDIPPGFWAVSQYLFNPVYVYNTRGPFARFNAVSSARSTKGILYGDLLLTQNVHPGLNLGFELRHAEDKTDYINMGTKLNSAHFFGSYARGRFFLNAAVSVNKMRSRSNGGILAEWWLLDTVADEATIPAHYTNTEAIFRSTDILIDAAFDLVQRGVEVPDSTNIRRIYREAPLSLLLLQRYRANSRAFFNRSVPALHPPYNMSQKITHDTVASACYEARLGVRYAHSPHSSIPIPSFKAWFAYRLSQFTMPNKAMYLRPDIDSYRHTVSLGGELDYSLPFGDLTANAAFNIYGYRALDSRVDAELQVYLPRWKERLLLSVDYEFAVESPSFFLNRYFSNTVAWNAHGEQARQVYTGLAARLKAPWWGGEYGVHNRIYGNYSYYGAKVLPRQDKALNVLALYAQQDFLMWGLSLRARLLAQHASDPDVLALPLLSSYVGLGYQYEVIKQVLTVKLGLEAYYRTLYRADAFNVPLGIYYRQNLYQIGNYPMVNLTLSAKWKTVNLYAMLEHVDEGFLGRNFFSGVLYPDFKRGFRFGLQWSFYN